MADIDIVIRLNSEGSRIVRATLAYNGLIQRFDFESLLAAESIGFTMDRCFIAE
jgi:hypothetical protein